jgi:hypothetical protein
LLVDPTLPKTIETRSRRTNIRGTIGIIAAQSVEGFYADVECFESGWVATMVGAYQATYCYRTSDEGRKGDTLMVKENGGDPAPDYDGPTPLGALIGTVDLYDCVPIIDGDECRAAATAPYPSHVCDGWERLQLIFGADDWQDVSDQRPYGDFTPGRWAWLTRNPVLFDESIPMRGAQHWQTVTL